MCVTTPTGTKAVIIMSGIYSVTWKTVVITVWNVIDMSILVKKDIR